MLQNVTGTPARRSLEFGIYRDGVPVTFCSMEPPDVS